MSAIGLSAASRGKGFAVSAYADIRHEQLFFERQQSLALRGMEWEGRIRPITSWSTLILRGLGVAVLASAILAVLI
jgi:hypothetical protein